MFLFLNHYIAGPFLNCNIEINSLKSLIKVVLRKCWYYLMPRVQIQCSEFISFKLPGIFLRGLLELSFFLLKFILVKQEV